MKKNPFDRPRCTAAGVATCSILAVTVAMGIALAFHVQPVYAAAAATAASTTATVRV